MLKSLRSTFAKLTDPFAYLAGPAGGADLLARQGEICTGRGDLPAALNCFEKSLAVNGDCVNAWAGLAEVFARLRDPRRAEACLDVARRLRGRNPREATA